MQCALNDALNDALSRDERRVLILDDDPTGSQSASGAEVLLRYRKEDFGAFLARGERAAYVLTNTRALTERDAVALVAELRRAADAAAAEANVSLAYVLRGDSTLRGHVFAEIDALGGPGAVTLFVPAFPEGGRRTIGGVHYMDSPGGLVPVARTEFASDPVFGYRSEDIAGWVAETGGGRPATTVPLAALRREGAAAVTAALLAAAPGEVVVPDAASEDDVARVVLGLMRAEELRCQVVVRSAATFAALRAGVRSTSLLEGQVLGSGRVLVVCGSHTTASTRQLREVEAAFGPAVVLRRPLVDGEGEKEIPALAAEVRERLDQRGFAALCTERVRYPDDDAVAISARVMDALVRVAAQVAPSCDAVIAKGGITSADVARRALSARSARVRGQILPGVSLWDITLPGSRTMPYVVVPGNVGTDATLVDVARRLGIERLHERRREFEWLSLRGVTTSYFPLLKRWTGKLSSPRFHVGCSGTFCRARCTLALACHRSVSSPRFSAWAGLPYGNRLSH